MKSHTVPRFLLDQFAYDDPKTKSRRLWQYAKGRAPSGKASPTTATRIDQHFSDPADAQREAQLETKLNQEFEDPVHKFLRLLSYWGSRSGHERFSSIRLLLHTVRTRLKNLATGN
jgi:hypothetical protein